jgi:cyanophycin synthetase
MTIHFSNAHETSPAWVAPSFRAWQKHALGLGLLPVISIAGDRGKSTVVRLLDAIFQRAGLRTATWTDLGVEIRSRKQRGEISGWSLALNRLSESSVDVAIQELHWELVNTVGLPPSSYPLVGITNLFGSHDGPMLASHEMAMRGTMRTLAAVHPQGLVSVCGDEFPLIDAVSDASCDVVVTSLAPDSPGLKRHLNEEGMGLWVENDSIVVGTKERRSTLLSLSDLPFALFGASPFLTSTAMTAISLAMAVGINRETITETLRSFRISDQLLPGSFNTYEFDGYRIVIDRVSNASHVRQLLRTVNPGHQRRQITVIGNLDEFRPGSVGEVGRMLGRHPGAVLLHSTTSPQLLEAFRRGIAANNYPPLFAYLPTERRALNRALKSARSDDVVLILTDDDPGPAIRAINRLNENHSDR